MSGNWDNEDDVDTLRAENARLTEALEDAAEALLSQHANLTMYNSERCIPTDDEVLMSYNAYQNAKKAIHELAKPRGKSEAL